MYQTSVFFLPSENSIPPKYWGILPQFSTPNFSKEIHSIFFFFFFFFGGGGGKKKKAVEKYRSGIKSLAVEKYFRRLFCGRFRLITHLKNVSSISTTKPCFDFFLLFFVVVKSIQFLGYLTQRSKWLVRLLDTV